MDASRGGPVVPGNRRHHLHRLRHPQALKYVRGHPSPPALSQERRKERDATVSVSRGLSK